MKKLTLPICALFMALMFCGSAFAAGNTVVIGLQAPVTGAWAYEGQMAKQSCELAAALINKKGGVLGGKKLEIRVVDDAGEPRSSALAAQKFVTQKDVVAVVSTYGSSVCEPAATIYERFRKVNVGYGATAVRLSQNNMKYFFRTCGRDDSQGRFFADCATKTFRAKRIAIMHDNTAFGKGLAEDTRAALAPLVKAGKVQIVYYDAITPGEKDFKVPLTMLREKKPDVWYYTGYYAEAALLVGQAREIGITCPFVGGNAAINSEFVKIAGLKVAKGCYMTNEPLPADLTYPMAKEFLAAYKAKYGNIPSSPWPIYAADAVNILAYSINRVGSTDSAKLAAYLHNNVNGVRGITGPIGFTAYGDREGVPFYLYKVDARGNIVVTK